MAESSNDYDKQLELLSEARKNMEWLKRHQPKKWHDVLFLSFSVITVLALLILLILELAK